MPHRRSVSLALILVLALTGCYSHIGVRPTELPKLNGAFTATSRSGNTQVTASTVRDVEADDGRAVRIGGDFDLIVTLKGGRRVVFDSPVIAELDGSALVLRGGNQAETRVELGDVQRTEVTQPNRTMFLLGAIAGGIGGALLLILILPGAKSGGVPAEPRFGHDVVPLRRERRMERREGQQDLPPHRDPLDLLGRQQEAHLPAGKAETSARSWMLQAALMVVVTTTPRLRSRAARLASA
jgi:hypothetical protein